MLTALALGVCACGDKTSKQFKAMEEEVKTVESQINASEDCDDLQMSNFSILGLRSDLDNLIQAAEIPDEEINKLDEMLTGLEATWGGKWASLGCDQIINDQEMDTSGEEDGEYQDYNVL
jgi:hypothetical protein